FFDQRFEHGSPRNAHQFLVVLLGFLSAILLATATCGYGDKAIRIGRISRVRGLSIKPRVSSVTAPRSAPSRSAPKTTGDVAAFPWISNRHSEAPRSIGVPSASVNSTLRSA